MADLLTEVARFEEWASTYPAESRSGEWECDYAAWTALHSAAREFLATRAFESWIPVETRAILFAIARDNEIQYLAQGIREEQPDLLVPLARAAIKLGECDDRWQLAEELGRVGRVRGAEEEVLLLLVEDAHEYVRRKALEALARLGASTTEQHAIRIWELPDPDQEWARMMCLWCLHKVGSSHLGRLLASAEQDSSQYLRGYAARVRKGEVDG